MTITRNDLIEVLIWPVLGLLVLAVVLVGALVGDDEDKFVLTSVQRQKVAKIACEDEPLFESYRCVADWIDVMSGRSQP